MKAGVDLADLCFLLSSQAWAGATWLVAVTPCNLRTLAGVHLRGLLATVLEDLAF